MVVKILQRTKRSNVKYYAWLCPWKKAAEWNELPAALNIAEKSQDEVQDELERLFCFDDCLHEFRIYIDKHRVFKTHKE